MTGALVILAVTVAVGLILYLTRDRSAVQSPTDETAEVCCGRHAVCEKGLISVEELYYNDEELDCYKGRDPESYTDDEIEEFREVLYTLRTDEVYEWGMALTMRDIPLPVQLRDEWMMMCDN